MVFFVYLENVSMIKCNVLHTTINLQRPSGILFTVCALKNCTGQWEQPSNAIFSEYNIMVILIRSVFFVACDLLVILELVVCMWFTWGMCSCCYCVGYYFGTVHAMVLSLQISECGCTTANDLTRLHFWWIVWMCESSVINWSTLMYVCFITKYLLLFHQSISNNFTDISVCHDFFIEIQ